MIGLSSLTSTQKRGIGILGGLAGAGLLATGVAVARSRAKKKRKSRTQRARKTSYRRPKNQRRIRRTPRTAGKRKDTSRRRIRYTKNGQPYVILASGKARFIKKKGAKQAHKRKGGRY